MPIDWFTVAAQLINFVILVWLLKRFLYKPILHAIDEREQGIAVQLAKAEATKAEAQKEQGDFQLKNEVFDQGRAALFQKATDEAAAERRQQLDAARKDADASRAKRREALQTEQLNLSREIIRRTRQEVFAVARKTLADLATASLEERINDVFIQRLRGLTGAAKEQLAAALKSSDQPPRVRSAFDLQPAQRNAVEKAIKEIFSADTEVRFETVPELVGGIELSANGRKLAWSIADYLTTLEKNIGELLPQDAQPDTDPDAKSKPAPEAEPTPGPKLESQNGLEAVPSAPKADH